MGGSKDISPYDAASERWQAVIREYAENGFVKYKAYAAVYDLDGTRPRDSLKTSATRLFTKDNFREALADYMSRNCMSTPEALSRLARLANEKDHGVQLAALDKILKAGGAYVTRTEHSGPGGGPMRLWQIVEAEGGDAVQ